MVFSDDEGRGVRSSKIPSQKISFPPSATLRDILEKGREMFYSELDIPMHFLHLADSSGQIINAEGDKWTIGKYFEENGYQPSRHKMYIMFKETVHLT